MKKIRRKIEMIEVKISIRMDGDEIPLIQEIKNLAKKHGVKENHFIYRIKNIGDHK